MKNFITASAPLFAMAAFVLSGCTDTPDPTTTSPPATDTSDHGHGHSHGGHSHSSEGPHGGDLIELGNDKYHAELVHPHDHGDDSHATGQARDHAHASVEVYILDGSAKNVVPIEAAEITLNLSHDGKPEQFKLGARPSRKDPEGKSSRFASDDKELMEHMHEAKHVTGTLVLQINGKSYRGELSHKHHNHAHGHSHGDHSHGSHEKDGHAHEEDNALVWHGDAREHGGLKIQLGHHGKHIHAGEAIEPAVSITRDGQPIDDAKVFNVLLSLDGEDIPSEEVATVFEPATKDKPAHYAHGSLAISKGVGKVVVRFRIVAPDADEVTFNLPLDVE